MTRTNNTRKPSQNGGFLDIVERYWLVLLGLIIGYPIIMRYFQDAGTKDAVNKIEEREKVLAAQTGNPITELQALNKITVNPAYHSRARNIAASLGTIKLTKEKDNFWSFVWIKPSTWTENEENVYLQLKDLNNTSQAKVITELYYILTRRNLRDDLLEYMPSDLIQKLPYFK